VRWLADFQKSYLGESPTGLWPVGSYWHLNTRPQELARMASGPLRDAAAALDRALSAPSRQTFVHGDAKVANFCFGDGVAAVDFQYVGGGIGLKDLAYFLGSCLDEAQLEAQAAEWLDRYFEALGDDEAEAQWRGLWPHAWADFERFLAGWSPGHWRQAGFAARMTQEALRRL
jgi:Ser/Thr protein kinase RdoA (MazF antagonist)